MANVIQAERGLPTESGLRPASPTDVAADLLFLGVVATSTTPFVFVFFHMPSPTRDLVLFYASVALALSVAAWRLLTGLPRIAVAALVTGTFLGLNVWIGQLGTDEALNYWTGWAPWVLSMAALVLGVSAGARRWHAWELYFVWLAVVVAAIQTYGIALLVSRGRMFGESYADGDFYGARPLHAIVALIMVVGFVSAILSPMLSSLPRVLVASFLGISVVLSQHRSVWLAMVVAVVLLAAVVLNRGLGWPAWTPLLATSGFAVAALIIPATSRWSILPAVPGVGDPGTGRLPDAATSSESLEWRLEVWRTRLVAPREVHHWLLGGIVDVNPVRTPGVFVKSPTLSGHSMYVDLLTMLGLVGVLAVAVILVHSVVWRRLDALAVSLWSLLLFGLFFDWPSWSWILLGTALTTKAVSSRASSEASPP